MTVGAALGRGEVEGAFDTVGASVADLLDFVLVLLDFVVFPDLPASARLLGAAEVDGALDTVGAAVLPPHSGLVAAIDSDSAGASSRPIKPKPLFDLSFRLCLSSRLNLGLLVSSAAARFMVTRAIASFGMVILFL